MVNVLLMIEGDINNLQLFDLEGDDLLRSFFNQFVKKNILKADYTVGSFFEKRCGFLLPPSVSQANERIRDIRDGVLIGDDLEHFKGTFVSWKDIKTHLTEPVEEVE